MNTTETPTGCTMCSTCSQCDARSCNANLTTAQHVQSSTLQMSLNNTQHKLHTSQLGRGNSPSVSAGFQNRENRKGQETEWNHFWMSGRWNAARCSLLIRSKRKRCWLQTVNNNHFSGRISSKPGSFITSWWFLTVLCHECKLLLLLLQIKVGGYWE